MRRNYITPDFNQSYTNGTMNMKETSSFLCSKIISLPNKIDIVSSDILYKENINGEQIDNSTLNNSIFSIDDNKKKYSSIILDSTQNNLQKIINCNYIITIDYKSILNDYIFYILKQKNTFYGISNNMTINNNVNNSIYSYINDNIIRFFKFNKTILYIKNNEIINSNNLQYSVKFNPLINSVDNIQNKYNLKLKDNYLIINYIQPLPSNKYNFDYYFDLNFDRDFNI